jgi:hypothetical protein
MSGPHFRDYHLILDEHASQIFAMTDEIAERTRKIRRDDNALFRRRHYPTPATELNSRTRFRAWKFDRRTRMGRNVKQFFIPFPLDRLDPFSFGTFAYSLP